MQLCIMPQQSISYAKQAALWEIWHSMERISEHLRPAIEGQRYINIIARIHRIQF